LALVALTVTLIPTSVRAQQFVLRDDVGGWGWLALTPTSRAVVQLAFGSPQRGDQGRLDLRVLESLRSTGNRRLWAPTNSTPPRIR
jgi:hypothetical protein